jgi:hypothetical protein
MKILGSLSQDGQLVVRQVEVEIDRVTQLSGGKEARFGNLYTLPSEQPSLQGRYTLALSDGRSNTIQFTGANRSGTGNVYQFEGVLL